MEKQTTVAGFYRGRRFGGAGSLAKHMNGGVRALDARDIPQVAQLYRSLPGKDAGEPSEVLESRLRTILLEHPWCDESIPSLVFEEERGRIVGCIGVLPRPMIFNGHRIKAAVSHSFIVQPGSRSTLAAFELAKHFLSGPQDLSMAEGSNVSRRIWERSGGSTSLLYSLCWTRPLRPSRYVLSFLRRRGLPAAVGWTLDPICRAIDTVTPLVPQKPFRLSEPEVTGGELDGGTLCRSIAKFANTRGLRPHYDEEGSTWLLTTLDEKRDRGAFRRVVVRDEHEAVGWYLSYENAGGIGEVVQVGAKDDRIDDVLDHLFHSARSRGLVAVTGQVDPALFHALAKKHCLFHHDGDSWMLIHSRDPELSQAIHQGDAFLSRLDGEWWISTFLS